MKILLDSGAFTLWKQQKHVIDLDEYIEFCLEYADVIWKAVNLDVIPGVPGQTRTRSQVEEAAKQSWKNSRRMRKRGIEPLPVFHQGEGFDWLEKMIEEGYDYIGLSPNKRRSTKEKMVWLDDCFGYLCGGGKYPPIKVHAFGEAAAEILFTYPWFSVDSTSWTLLGGLGKILVPPPSQQGDYAWDRKPLAVSISSKGGRGGTDYRTLGTNLQHYIREYAGSLGFSPKLLAENDKARKRLNIRYYCKVAESRTSPSFCRGPGFFGPSSSLGVDSWEWGSLRFVFVSSITVDNCFVVSIEDCGYSLLSYYNLKKEAHRKFDLRDYVSRGWDYLREWNPTIAARIVRSSVGYR